MNLIVNRNFQFQSKLKFKTLICFTIITSSKCLSNKMRSRETKGSSKTKKKGRKQYCNFSQGRIWSNVQIAVRIKDLFRLETFKFCFDYQQVSMKSPQHQFPILALPNLTFSKYFFAFHAINWSISNVRFLCTELKKIRYFILLIMF